MKTNKENRWVCRVCFNINAAANHTCCGRTRAESEQRFDAETREFCAYAGLIPPIEDSGETGEKMTTKMTTVEQEVTQAFNRAIADIRQTDPTFGDAFLRRVRQPRYRYFHQGNRAYCWTVEPARDEKGRMRYASWVARLSKKYITPIQSTRRDHVKRQDAKARALKLYEEAKAEVQS